MTENTETLDDLILNDPEMVGSFVAESRDHLSSIEDDLLNLEKQKDNPDQSQLDKVFRAIHSVKGAAGFLGLKKMSELAHVMEALLTRMRSGKILPESEYIDSLLAGVDLLSTMLQDIKQSNEVDISVVHEQILSYQNTPKKPVEDEPDNDGGKISTEIKETAPRAVTVPPSKEAKSSSGTVYRKKSGVNLANTVRVNIDILDKLMAQAGELVLIRNQHLLTVDETDPESRAIAHRLDLITSELQETILRSRMQPVGKVIDKFPRVVRDLAKSLGKKIQVKISGGNAELDKTILESLTDPLTHIIRNCCSHGIESPEERANAGKPKTGTITITAFHDSGRVNIKITDDGQGVDVRRIKAKVLEKGLKSENDLERMTNQEILQLVFLPGFSTTQDVDDVSGRGVGLDVVKTSIDKLGGSFDFVSKDGIGTTILLRIPLTLAITPALIIKSRDNIYAIPQASLVELVSLYDDEQLTKIEHAGEHEFYRLRDRLLPLIRLDDLLVHPKIYDGATRTRIAEKYFQKRQAIRQQLLNEGKGISDYTNDESLNIVVLKVGGNQYGLIVDKIMGTEEIVIKPLHASINALKIYSGATIMGNGRATLILDIPGIARHTGISLTKRIIKDEAVGSKDDELQSILLFKSGPKEQFALPLPLIRRIEPININAIEQIGDLEYITIDNTSTQIVRLENILNVTKIEEQEDMFLILPKHLKRPVGILMSSYIDTLEIAVELETETLQADGLLGTAIIKNSMTLFLDFFRLAELSGINKIVEQTEHKTPAPPVVSSSSAKVLLLEDISFFRNLIKGYLEQGGHEVVAVPNGQVGLNQLDENEFDLIVSDLEMPVLNGWEFIRTVKSNKSLQHLPSIALTSLDNKESREKALSCGFDYYEVKLDRDHFLATVTNALRKDNKNN